MVRPNASEVLPYNRQKLSEWVEGNITVRLITALIVVNAITLGLETDTYIYEQYGSWLFIIDRIILIIFTIEMVLKLYAYRLMFFRSGWNVFDLIIVSASWMPTTGALSVFRTLRVLRILRLLSVVPQLRRVISALGHSIPGMISVLGVLLLIFYVSAVLATKLFGVHPDEHMQEWFGTIGASAYTLFQIMTLESWSMGIVRPTMELFPLSWMFFIPFIVITSFAVLNLFIGIIVDAMQVVQKETREIDRTDIKSFTHDEILVVSDQIETLHAEITKLKQMVSKNTR